MKTDKSFFRNIIRNLTSLLSHVRCQAGFAVRANYGRHIRQSCPSSPAEFPIASVDGKFDFGSAARSTMHRAVRDISHPRNRPVLHQLLRSLVLLPGILQHRVGDPPAASPRRARATLFHSSCCLPSHPPPFSSRFHFCVVEL